MVLVVVLVLKGSVLVLEKGRSCSSVLWSVLVLVWAGEYHWAGERGTMINDDVPGVSCRITCARISIVSYTEKYREKNDPSRWNWHEVSVFLHSTIVFLRRRSRRYTMVILHNTVSERIVDAHWRVSRESVIVDVSPFLYWWKVILCHWNACSAHHDDGDGDAGY